MRLREARRRLPIVDELPRGRGRRFTPDPEARVPRCSLAVWELTLACDQRCLHCGPRAGDARDAELGTEECLRLADELAELGVGEVVLIGGEAYLRGDFPLIVRRIRERGMSCIVTTGGYGLTPARAAAMAEAGVSSVSVSIDGLEASHDYVRGRPDSWKRAFQALRNAREVGLAISVNSQINSRSYPELPELLELIAAEGIFAWQFQLTVAHGGAADHPELLVQPYMLAEILDMFGRRLLPRMRELEVRPFPGNSIGYFGPWEQEVRYTQRQSGHWEGCEAGRSLLGIESDGGIKACPTLGGPTNIGGSWREHGLRAIWEGAPELTYTRERTVEELWGFCRTCYYADTCRAGCTAVTESLLGRPGNNPYCHHRVLEFARRGLRERVEPVMRPFGTPFDQGMFRLVLEPIDAEERARRGPVEITEPRVTRIHERLGPGTPFRGST